MRLLVLGGTAFLSRAVAEEALRRGHDVVCAARGASVSVPPGARLLAWDRTGPPPDELAELASGVDAVVDVARHPSWVRRAVRLLPDAHWVFVSSISVHPDHGTPGGTPETLATLEPLDEDADPMASPETYGAMKVACERHVRAGAATSLVVRPGLIVGPGDPTGRFSYWPARLADTAAWPEVLVPGSPDDSVQLIDVRDLAGWLVESAERRRTGLLDGVARPMTRAAFVDAVAAAARDLGRHDPATSSFTAVDQEFLLEQGVEPWMGPDSIPLWLPQPAYAGMMAHDPAASYAAGLVTRPLAETARDTLLWLDEHPEAVVTGIGRSRESDILAAWHAARA
ncbi:NAD-dependent epimerase/dehydratase family protein [Nocardioides sp.]|uniref:NAD-dependent epimerase/dehydratase family protein n=1 Tax=Nocardioides sp. TaxID=35761 RepID=UPI003562BD5C